MQKELEEQINNEKNGNEIKLTGEGKMEGESFARTIERSSRTSNSTKSNNSGSSTWSTLFMYTTIASMPPSS